MKELTDEEQDAVIFRFSEAVINQGSGENDGKDGVRDNSSSVGRIRLIRDILKKKQYE